MIVSSLNGVNRIYYIIGKEYPLSEEGDAGCELAGVRSQKSE
jgi:hypothetical protein